MKRIEDFLFRCYLRFRTWRLKREEDTTKA